MPNVNTLPRRFKIGATMIADPASSMTLKEVHELLAQQFPLIRHTQLFDSDARISECCQYLDYEFVLPPVKTNG